MGKPIGPNLEMNLPLQRARPAIGFLNAAVAGSCPRDHARAAIRGRVCVND
jgi:hypothetical protein